MTTQEQEPLWSNERINMFADNMPTAWEAKRVHDLMVKVRDDYEAKLTEYQGVYEYYIALAEQHEQERATLTAQLAEAQAHINELADRLDVAQNTASVVPSEPLISNAEMEQWARGIRDKTSSDSAYELLVRLRGTYERQRVTLTARIAELDQRFSECTTSLITADRRIAELEQQLAEAQAGRWMPVKGPVIIQLAPGVMVTFREDSAEGLGATEEYPNGFRLCRWQEGSEA